MTRPDDEPYVDPLGRVCGDDEFIRLCLQGAHGLEVAGWCATGSRAILPQAPADSDRDFIILIGGVRRFYEKELQRLGFRRGGYKSSTGEPTDGFFSAWRLPAPKNDPFEATELDDKAGSLNVVVTASQDFFDKYVLATRISRRLALTSKADRIAVFEAIVYGKVSADGN